MENELGKFLRGKRGNRTLRDIADRTNGKISHSYLSDIEKGVTRQGNVVKPSFEKLKALSKVYHVPLTELVRKAGYQIDNIPEWATEEEIVEIESILDEKTEMTVGGEVLPPDKAQQVRNILRGALYEELERKKKQRK